MPDAMGESISNDHAAESGNNAPPSSGPWRARPVFISSTFKDMQQERDYLRNHVFPRIAEELAKRRHHLEPIDLRLGVETGKVGTEEARELLVLKVCLDEIKRSRPFLLVLLGDRYGWVPPEERIKTASREQGFETNATGKSVTALEIEFGILKGDADQQQRSLFFFRRPLPWDKLPEAERANYSDAHSPDAEVRAGHDKLVALKNKLKNDRELGPRVYDYTAAWDAATSKVTDLKAFGDLVYKKLWEAIDAETKAFASQAPPTWEEQEKVALAEFVEHRSRIFVGREALMSDLLGIARSPAVAADKPIGDSTWGACIVGLPGSGKSAVFAKLHRELEKDRSILVLANAAGGTQRGSSVDAMLRRFIAELATSAGVDNPLPKQASPDDVEKVFYSLLYRVSASRRVVVLLDALDQTEQTPRGRHLTWFKARQWHANARIIATTLPCPAADVLAQSAGIEEIDLPPLTADDAAEVGRQVWGRYHRELNPDVLKVLVEKRLTDGQPSCGNPLWLTLALEQLNLLDADDFARAQRDFAGSPAQRMTALLLDTANHMPPDIGGLYGWLLEQNEKAFGVAHARGFAMAIALSRYGWREADLLDLVPRLGKLLLPGEAVTEMDDLGLASLRRGFRAHLVRRGENGQIDFFYAQMCRAMVGRCAPQDQIRQSLHASISDYLESLSASDLLIRLERMGQLIGQHDALRAAQYYAICSTASEPTIERIGATWTLVDWIAVGASVGEENPNLAWITSWLKQPELTPEQIHRLTLNFQYGLFERMENDVALGTRLPLVEAVRDALGHLASSDPTNAERQRDLSVSHIRIGEVLRAQGDLAGALSAYQKAHTIFQRLASSDPSNVAWQRDLAVSHKKIGDVLLKRGDLSGALQSYRKFQEAMDHLVASDPSNAAWQHDLWSSCLDTGDVLLAQGNLEGAIRDYGQYQVGMHRLTASDPSNASWQYDLGVSHERIGSALQARGDLAGALVAFKKRQAIISRLMTSDPIHGEWQRDLAVSQEKIGDVLRLQGDLAGSIGAHREAMAVRQRLVLSDPSNVGWQRDLSVTLNKIGDVLLAQGDPGGAVKAYRESLAVRQRLASTDPSNAGWQRDLAASYGRVGGVLLSHGDLAGALRALRDAQTISRRLALSDRSNAVWQGDLALSHYNLAMLFRQNGTEAELTAELRACFAVLDAMQRRNVCFSPQMAQVYARLSTTFGN